VFLKFLFKKFSNIVTNGVKFEFLIEKFELFASDSAIIQKITQKVALEPVDIHYRTKTFFNFRNVRIIFLKFL